MKRDGFQRRRLDRNSTRPAVASRLRARRGVFAICIFLVAITWIVFGRTVGHDFVNYDDPNTSFTPNAQGVNSNANFGKITSSLPARRIQLGLRLSF